MRSRSFLLCVVLVCAAALLTVPAQAAKRKLLVVGEILPPYEMWDTKSQQVVGRNIDLLKHIFGKMGVDHEIQIMPWLRCWMMLQSGDADAALSVSFTEERLPHLFYPSTSLWESEFVFFTQKHKKLPALNGVEDAKRLKLKIGIISGNSYHASFWQAFPYQDAAGKVLHPQIEAANNVDQNLTKLANGRFDLFPFDLKSGQAAIARLGLGDSIAWYDKVLFSKPYFMVYAKKSRHPDIEKIAEQFDRELAAMKQNGQYEAMTKKWVH